MLLTDNHQVDNTLKLPLALYVFAVIFFPTPAIVLLFLDGKSSSAFLLIVGMTYAVGLGRVLLWRRLGRPAVPAHRGRVSNTARHPS